MSRASYIYISEFELKILQDLFVIKNKYINQMLLDSNANWSRIARYNPDRDAIKISIVETSKLEDYMNY